MFLGLFSFCWCQSQEQHTLGALRPYLCFVTARTQTLLLSLRLFNPCPHRAVFIFATCSALELPQVLHPVNLITGAICTRSWEMPAQHCKLEQSKCLLQSPLRHWALAPLFWLWISLFAIHVFWPQISISQFVWVCQTMPRLGEVGACSEYGGKILCLPPTDGFLR